MNLKSRAGIICWEDSQVAPSGNFFFIVLQINEKFCRNFRLTGTCDKFFFRFSCEFIIFFDPRKIKVSLTIKKNRRYHRSPLHGPRPVHVLITYDPLCCTGYFPCYLIFSPHSFSFFVQYIQERWVREHGSFTRLNWDTQHREKRNEIKKKLQKQNKAEKNDVYERWSMMHPKSSLAPLPRLCHRHNEPVALSASKSSMKRKGSNKKSRIKEKSRSDRRGGWISSLSLTLFFFLHTFVHIYTYISFQRRYRPGLFQGHVQTTKIRQPEGGGSSSWGMILYMPSVHVCASAWPTKTCVLVELSRKRKILEPSILRLLLPSPHRIVCMCISASTRELRHEQKSLGDPGGAHCMSYCPICRAYSYTQPYIYKFTWIYSYEYAGSTAYTFRKKKKFAKKIFKKPSISKQYLSNTFFHSFAFIPKCDLVGMNCFALSPKPEVIQMIAFQLTRFTFFYTNVRTIDFFQSLVKSNK